MPNTFLELKIIITIICLIIHVAPKSSQVLVQHVSLYSGSNSNLAVLVFEEKGKTGVYTEKNLSEQSREPTNSTHIGRRNRESNPGHRGGRRVLYWWLQHVLQSGITNSPSAQYIIVIITYHIHWRKSQGLW